MSPENGVGGDDRIDDKRDVREQPSSNDTSMTEAEDDGSELERRHSIVQQLARQMTRSTTIDVQGNSTAIFANTDPESALNPNSPNFNAGVWAKSLAKMAQEQGQGNRQSGICFQNMSVYGFGAETDYQKDVGNIWNELPSLARGLISPQGKKRRIDILHDFDGIVEPGEMCVVLGPPGAGCTTFLKTIAGETNGLYVDGTTQFNYHGIPAAEMHSSHRAEAIYTAEVDVHFPQLSVGDTLTFASRARSPRTLPPGVTHDQFCNHHRDVVMAMYGISHTVDTRVGNEYVRGVSGGERKRVTIAEATLAGAPLQCWDNSTRGLDSANAIEFCKTLRLQADLFGRTSLVSIYQSPQSAYDLFDKVVVVYEGHQIFFGRTGRARDFFERMGFECPSRQTTPDFLTSMTAPTERVVRPGWEDRVPRTPEEFAARWKASPEYRQLHEDIQAYNREHPLEGPDAEAFRQHKKEAQAKGQRLNSPYTLSYAQQIRLCVWRGWQRLKGDPWLTIFALIANSATGLIISSLYYNMQPTTQSFYGRGAILFVAILSNAFASALEILTQYSQRPIVEKHTRYGFYHSSAEAFSSILVDMPYKIANSILYNLIMYFMTNLRREPGAYFFFLLVSFLMVLSMSGLFRSM
jgi:ABC-type multidrug transport system ATPase subunit